MTTNTDTGNRTSANPSETTKAQHSVRLEPLRPILCIQRDDNTVVPLIAIDELPESVVLTGIPTTLTVLEALKSRMQLVNGVHPVHGLRYQLDRPISTQTSASEREDVSGSDDPHTPEGSQDSTQKGSKSADAKASRLSALTVNGNGITDPLAKKGTLGKKIYCTYWIQTGNCNYMQQGCKFLHEIPEDEETRRAIGFREVPQWPRDEMPIQRRPGSAVHKNWRRQGGKPEFSNAPIPSNRVVGSPATIHGTPKVIPRDNSHMSASLSPNSPKTNTQYHPNIPSFAAPHQHFPMHVNNIAAQRPFSKGVLQPFLTNGVAENSQQRQVQDVSPPSYNHSTSHNFHGARSDSANTPKQPPISRPTSLGQPSPIQPQLNGEASTRRVAPDHHVVNQASGSTSTSNGKQGHNLHAPFLPSPQNLPAPYLPSPQSLNPWYSQANAPTLMDINFIAPSSESTRSGSHAIYTPSSANTTPTHNIGTAYGNSNGHNISDTRAGTPAHYNGKYSTNSPSLPMNIKGTNLPINVKGRGPVQFGLNSSPVPSSRIAPQATTPTAASSTTTTAAVEESDTTISIMSPPIMHRAMFRKPGEPEYVSNPPEPKTNGKAAAGPPKKHGRKANTAATKSAKGKMSGNGYDVPIDMANPLI